MGLSAAATSHAGALGDSKDAFLRLHGVALGYRGSAVLHDLSFALHVGEVLALVGANGCGKTTLLRALAGLAVPLAGEIDWDGGRPTVGVLFQNETAAPFTVRELVTLGLGVNGRPSLPQRQRVQAILADLDLGALAERQSAELSGGEWQRARVARALVAEPRLLLLDEPTNHLDPARRAELFVLLKALKRRVSIVLATHDLDLAARCDRVVLLGDRRLLAVGGPDDVMTPTLLPQALGAGVERWDPPGGGVPFFRLSGGLA